MINTKLERKREADRKSYWKRRILSAGLEFDPMLTSAQLKAVFYEVTNKLPRKKKPKPIVPTQDHISEQTYSALDEMRKEEAAEKLTIRENLPEGVSSLIKDKGNFDQIPLEVINNSHIDIDQYIYNRKKKQREKAKKSSWRM